MSNIPPYQMSAPPGGPPPQGNKTAPWVWVLVGLAGMCVICGVIGAAVLFPVFAQARLAARKSVSVSQAKRVATAVMMYSADFDDTMPPIKDGAQMYSLLEKYVDNSNSYSSDRTKKLMKEKAAGYTWDMDVSGKDLVSISNVSESWMFYSSEPAESKTVSLAYLDGHVRAVDRGDLASKTVKPIFEKPTK